MDRQKLKCLIIDDNYQFGTLLLEGLQPYFDSDFACDAFTAQQLAAQKKYDIVLSDVHMPIVDGLDLAEELRKKMIHIPTIFITGDLSPEVSKRVLALGAANLVEKPLNIDELIGKMQLAIRLHDDQQESCSDQELGYVYNLLKSHYYDIQDILYQIQYYHVPISVVKSELDKKERMGRCYLDEPEGIKLLGAAA